MQLTADKDNNNINLLNIINIVNSVNNMVKNRLQDINNAINNTFNTAVKTDSAAVIKSINYNIDTTVHTKLKIFIKDLNKVKTAEESVIKYNSDDVNYAAHICKRTTLDIITAYFHLTVNIVNDYIHLFNKKQMNAMTKLLYKNIL